MKTDFQLLMNNPNSNEYMVAIKNIPLEEKKTIIQQIKRNQIRLKMDSNNYQLTLHTQHKDYYFDMSAYQKLMNRFQTPEMGIGLVFMNEDNQIARDFVQFFVVKTQS